MVIEIVPISSLRFEKVQYYSIRVDGSPLAFRDFHTRMSQNPKNQFELGEINRYIEQIGEKLGAYPQHFKSEDAAEALPPPYHSFIESDINGDYGLRLYCIRLSQSIVILLNGDRKTALKVKDCKNCYPHFNLARKLAKKITQAILDDEIQLNEENKVLSIDEDFEIIL